LFEHLELEETRAKLFPQIPTVFRVARAQDTIRHPRKADVLLGYGLDSEGRCRYIFRWSERAAKAQGGGAGRAMGVKDVGQHVETTIYLEKFDPKTNEIIQDKHLPDPARRPGQWRAFMVTFPLREPVREVTPADVAFPVAYSPFADWMTDEERAARDRQVNRRTRPGSS